jgi:hypothetical protein
MCRCGVVQAFKECVVWLYISADIRVCAVLFTHRLQRSGCVFEIHLNGLRFRGTANTLLVYMGQYCT